MSDDWKKAIPLWIRIKIFIRDWLIQHIKAPWQTFRRRHGMADRDLFSHLKIQTNYRCTRRCSFCHYGMTSPPENIDMPEGLYRDIIDQLSAISYCGSIGLFECNEPLTDKRLPEFIRYARKKLPGAWLSITTNGDLLKDGTLDELFEDGINFIYLNSYDDGAKVRNLAFRDKLTGQRKKLLNHIDRTYQQSWTSRAGNLSQFRQGSNNHPCDMVYTVMYIKPSGKVYSCINDFFDVNEMGDLNSENLLDVWFGSKLRELRRHLNAGDRQFSSLCRQCDYKGYGNLPKIPWAWRRTH